MTFHCIGLKYHEQKIVAVWKNTLNCLLEVKLSQGLKAQLAQVKIDPEA